jgi:hypothetical protein
MARTVMQGHADRIEPAPHETNSTVMNILTGVGILVSFLDFVAQRVPTGKTMGEPSNPMPEVGSGTKRVCAGSGIGQRTLRTGEEGRSIPLWSTRRMTATRDLG